MSVPPAVGQIALTVLLVAAAGVVLSENRRMIILSLGAQYVATAGLASMSIGGGIASVKVVAGLSATAIIALSYWTESFERVEGSLLGSPIGRPFKAMALALVWVAAWGLTREGMPGIPQLDGAAAIGAALLAMSGLLQIGLFEDPLRAGVGIAALLSGFEIAYVAMEQSLAVLALLAGVHLGLAMVVVYLHGLEAQARGTA